MKPLDIPGDDLLSMSDATLRHMLTKIDECAISFYSQPIDDLGHHDDELRDFERALQLEELHARLESVLNTRRNN